MLFNLNISTIKEPSSYSSAITNPNWQQGITNERKSLNDTHTWDIIPLPPNKKEIGCKWIFKLNFVPNGIIVRYKVRLVAKGFS